MKITEQFVETILSEYFGSSYQAVFDDSPLLQYLDLKTKAVHGNTKTRRSLANLYAIYAILFFYCEDFANNRESYLEFDGYDYMKLFHFYRGLYGGSKLQNHALNSRVNGEFRNKVKGVQNDLIIASNGKYLIHVDYLYVHETDIASVCCKIIERYMQLLISKDNKLIEILENMGQISTLSDKKQAISNLLNEDAEARIFEIISYAILKNHYHGITIYIGYTKESIQGTILELYKTGRTNANDGGIDFVMRPLGRFFQVTEVNNYDKYLLDIDKVMHYPITFVIKTRKSKKMIEADINSFIIARSHGMRIVANNYRNAIEEIITINELEQWLRELSEQGVNDLIRDIDLYYRMEMNLEIPTDDDE